MVPCSREAAAPSASGSGSDCSTTVGHQMANARVATLLGERARQHEHARVVVGGGRVRRGVAYADDCVRADDDRVREGARRQRVDEQRVGGAELAARARRTSAAKTCSRPSCVVCASSNGPCALTRLHAELTPPAAARRAAAAGSSNGPIRPPARRRRRRRRGARGGGRPAACAAAARRRRRQRVRRRRSPPLRTVSARAGRARDGRRGATTCAVGDVAEHARRADASPGSSVPARRRVHQRSWLGSGRDAETRRRRHSPTRCGDYAASSSAPVVSGAGRWRPAEQVAERLEDLASCRRRASARRRRGPVACGG